MSLHLLLALAVNTKLPISDVSTDPSQKLQTHLRKYFFPCQFPPFVLLQFPLTCRVPAVISTTYPPPGHHGNGSKTGRGTSPLAPCRRPPETPEPRHPSHYSSREALLARYCGPKRCAEKRWVATHTSDKSHVGRAASR